MAFPLAEPVVRLPVVYAPLKLPLARDGDGTSMVRSLAPSPLLPRSASGSNVRGNTARSPSKGMLLLVTVVVLGTLLPLSVLHRAPSCPDTLGEAGQDSAQLAVLAQLAQQNEELLRDLTNRENVPSLGRPVSDAPRREEDALPDRPAAAVAAAVQAAPLQLAQPTGSPLASGAPRLWLRMAVMTVGRKDSSEYLLRTLVSILEQLPPHDPLSAHVQVLVVNNQQPPEAHLVLAQAQRRFGGHPNVRFVTKRPPVPPLKCPGTPHTQGSNRVPGEQTGPRVPGRSSLLLSIPFPVYVNSAELVLE